LHKSDLTEAQIEEIANHFSHNMVDNGAITFERHLHSPRFPEFVAIRHLSDDR